MAKVLFSRSLQVVPKWSSKDYQVAAKRPPGGHQVVTKFMYKGSAWLVWGIRQWGWWWGGGGWGIYKSGLGLVVMMLGG